MDIIFKNDAHTIQSPKTITIFLLLYFFGHPKFLSYVFQLQQLEEAELQQREANLTALAAIGPRKKRPLEQAEGQVSLIFCSPAALLHMSTDMQYYCDTVDTLFKCLVRLSIGSQRLQAAGFSSHRRLQFFVCVSSQSFRLLV